MKKLFQFVLLLLVLSPISDALAQYRPEVGLKAGGALAQMRGEEDTFGQRTTDRQPGFLGGLYVELPVTSQLSIQPEILYSQKGGRMKESLGSASTMTSDFNLDYVEMPVVLKYNFSQAGRLQPSIFAGPYAAYSVNRDIAFKFSDEDFNFNIGAEDIFRRWDYGATAGVDFGYMIGMRKATVGLRYDLGLANIFQDDINFDSDELELQNATARNHEVGIVLGFRLF